MEEIRMILYFCEVKMPPAMRNGISRVSSAERILLTRT